MMQGPEEMCQGRQKTPFSFDF